MTAVEKALGAAVVALTGVTASVAMREPPPAEPHTMIIHRASIEQCAAKGIREGFKRDCAFDVPYAVPLTDGGFCECVPRR